jgi:hypothetical protein
VVRSDSEEPGLSAFCGRARLSAFSTLARS